jgi:delta(3,5)-delta(2,4)-dienoyl-CoA isomerase
MEMEIETKPHPLDKDFRYLKLSIPANSPNVTIVILDRPKKRNAISAALWREIGEAFRRLGRLGDGCRCIMLVGNGKAFTAGIDVSDPSFFPDPDAGQDIAREGLTFMSKILDMQRCFTAIEECPVPVVAAIHGSCIGAGVDLASCCDVRLCAPGSIFSVREVRLGLAADVGTLQRLPKITSGDSRVRELCLTGGNFDDKEAVSIGFVSRIAINVFEDALALCSAIAANSPVATLGTKKSLVYSRDHSVADGLEHIASHNAMALMTDDVAASFQAATSKTQPNFANFPPFSRL